MRWFTSDQHFWHANVIKYCNRPYLSVEEMNEKLLANYNTLVTPSDTVYMLGDFSLALRPVELYGNRLMGNKKLVPGNHDWVHPVNKKARTEHRRLDNVAKYNENGLEVLDLITDLALYNGTTVRMCHLPYASDFTDTRYQDYRPRDEGLWLLCGHVHEKWLKKGRMINVGVDVWDYKPVSEAQIIEIINNG